MLPACNRCTMPLALHRHLVTPGVVYIYMTASALHLMAHPLPGRQVVQRQQNKQKMFELAGRTSLEALPARVCWRKELV